MSHYIVLVKQVPDVSQITDNAFDPNTGNLIRTRLPSVINELDSQALAFAWRMKGLSGDTAGKVICLSMGPPMAAEVLRYGLSRCADEAVLLTDRALGGGGYVGDGQSAGVCDSKDIGRDAGRDGRFLCCGGDAVG